MSKRERIRRSMQSVKASKVSVPIINGIVLFITGSSLLPLCGLPAIMGIVFIIFAFIEFDDSNKARRKLEQEG